MSYLVSGNVCFLFAKAIAYRKILVYGKTNIRTKKQNFFYL